MKQSLTIGMAVRSKGGCRWKSGQVVGYSFARDRFRVHSEIGDVWASISSLCRLEPVMSQDELMDEAEFMLAQGEHPHQLPIILNRNWEVLLRLARKTGRTGLLEQMVAASEAERLRKVNA